MRRSGMALAIFALLVASACDPALARGGSGRGAAMPPLERAPRMRTRAGLPRIAVLSAVRVSAYSSVRLCTPLHTSTPLRAITLRHRLCNTSSGSTATRSTSSLSPIRIPGTFALNRAPTIPTCNNAPAGGRRWRRSHLPRDTSHRGTPGFPRLSEQGNPGSPVTPSAPPSRAAANRGSPRASASALRRRRNCPHRARLRKRCTRVATRCR